MVNKREEIMKCCVCNGVAQTWIDDTFYCGRCLRDKRKKDKIKQENIDFMKLIKYEK